MRIECVRSGAVRLCLALILGLLVVSGYVVAPVLFAQAGSTAEAGRLAGEVFHLVNLGALLIAIAVGSFWIRVKETARFSWVLLISLLILVGVNEYGISPVIVALKETAGPIDALATDDPKRIEFGIWHRMSAIFHLLATVVAASLVMVGDHKRETCKES
jgi:hypothetical protein